MNYDWFKIFNHQEFLKTGLTSRNLNLFLSEYGQRQVMITRGDLVSLVLDDVILPVEFMGKNPYVRDGRAIYKDENGDVFLGFEVP